MTPQELHEVNLRNGIAKAVHGALAGLRDSEIADRLGVSEWSARLLRQRSVDWEIDDVSDLLLAVGAEIRLAMDGEQERMGR